MERTIAFSEGEFYHVYNRGVDKRRIFLTEDDSARFLALLYMMNDCDTSHMGRAFRTKDPEAILARERGQPLVAIGAFCLMPNHFHLLLTPVVDGGVSKFMLKLQTAYSMYFNKMNKRSGALFQGKFKAEHADTDEYLHYLYAYIHLNSAALVNPKWKELSRSELVKTRKSIETYPYSSCAAYLSDRHTITDPKPFPKYFARSGDFKKMLDFWTDYHTSM